VYYRDLLFVLVGKEFKVRYKNTALGYFWSVLHPLAFAGVLFVLFKVIVKIRMEDYLLFLISGLFAWQWFSNSINAATAFFLSNSSLILKIRFPRFFLVLAGVMSDMVHFLISIPVLVVFMLGYGRYPSPAWLWGVPILAAAQFLLTYGVALMMATSNLFLRDLGRLTSILTMLWFYVTPVVFQPEMVPEAYRWMLYVNPMSVLTIAWRELFLAGRMPWGLTAAALGYGLLACAVGHLMYRKLEWRFAEVV
jgi:lipopolysaccharide transport system permease protein